MKTLLSLLLLVLLADPLGAQNLPSIQELQKELEEKQQALLKLENEWEALELAMIRAKSRNIGYPADTLTADTLILIERDGFAAGFSQKHQQAQWVMHMILPEISNRCWDRTNDFRADTLLAGSPTLEEYKFGDRSNEFDKGHLAPAADFRWCEEAVSASFLLSNMSPQPAEFNRGIWADLEKVVRSYITRNPGSELYVVSGPLLEDNLEKLKPGVQISVPVGYFKVVLDRKRGQGIAFLLDADGRKSKRSNDAALLKAAISIDALEERTGLDFFPDISSTPSLAEANFEPFYWLPFVKGISPIPLDSLAEGQINTAMLHTPKSGEVVNVAGTIVHATISPKGNITLYLDRRSVGTNGRKSIPYVFKPFLESRIFRDFPEWKQNTFHTADPGEKHLEALIGKRVTVSGKLYGSRKGDSYKINLTGSSAIQLEK